MIYKEKSNRIWELDLFRGVALILMIYFHIIYDMKDIYGYNVVYDTGVNYYLGKLSAILFILISGISSYLSKSNLKRGLKLLGIAMLITVATQVYNPNLIIKFGILHFLGVSIVLAPMIKNVNAYLLIISGTLIISMYSVITRIYLSNDYFFMIGITRPGFLSSDYYPLIPWLGVFLYGMVIGDLFYFKRDVFLNVKMNDNVLCRVGRHTLLVYLVHQPIILAVLTAINYIRN